MSRADRKILSLTKQIMAGKNLKVMFSIDDNSEVVANSPFK